METSTSPPHHLLQRLRQIPERQIVLAFLGFLALLGIGLILFYTREGVGARDDAVRYVMGADNILAGNGYRRTTGGGELRRETGFPPMMSYTLALLGLSGLDLYLLGRWMNALVFGGTIFLAGWLVYRYSGSGLAAWLAAIILLVAPNMVEWHAWLMSEALYIFLSLLGLAALLQYLESRRPVFLLAAALLVCMATLTRYVGFSLIAAGGLALLFGSFRPWRGRLIDGLIFGALTFAAVFVWLQINQDPETSLTNRRLMFHAMDPLLARTYLYEAASWFVPVLVRVNRILRAGIALLVAAPGPAVAIWTFIRKKAARQRPYAWLPLLLALYSVFYVLILLANSLLLDAGTTLSAPPRYLLPLFVALAILLVVSYHEWLAMIRIPHWARAVAGVVLVAFLSLKALTAISLAWVGTPSMGFTSLRADNPQAVEFLARRPPGSVYISNNPEMLYYLIGESAYIIPIRYDPYQRAFREDYEEQIRAARARLEQGALLVVFDVSLDVDQEMLADMQVELLQDYPTLRLYQSRAEG